MEQISIKSFYHAMLAHKRSNPTLHDFVLRLQELILTPEISMYVKSTFF